MSDREITISATLPDFLTYLKVELRQSTATIDKYRGNILAFVRAVGDLQLERVSLQDCMAVKSQMMTRGVRDSGVASMMYAVKSFLAYAREVLHLPVMDI